MTFGRDARLAASVLLALTCQALVFTGLLAGSLAEPPQAARAAAAGARLLAAYPDHLASIEAGALVWKDGTRMPLDDRKGEKSFEALLSDPDLEDIFAIPYAAGDPAGPPAKDQDPGRARPSAFFDKMYGDCRKGEVTAKLAEIVWLPEKSGTRLKVTTVNGVHARLAAISEELDRLPAALDIYLKPSGGTYNCRVIAGTSRISSHGQGIAIDIGLKRSHYWRWTAPERDGTYAYKNEIPLEIVRIFERHGFIWGGKWYHYDTMHFEYRPELLLPAARP